MVDEVSTDGRTGKETADKFISGDLVKPKHGYKEGGSNGQSGMINKKTVEYPYSEKKREDEKKEIVDSYSFIEEGDQDVK